MWTSESLQHIAKNYNTLQQNRWHASHICVMHESNFSPPTEIHLGVEEVAARHCKTLRNTAERCNTLQHTATLRNTLKHTRYNAPHSTNLHYSASYRTTPCHTAPHCNTLHYIAAYCNTLGGGRKWKSLSHGRSVKYGKEMEIS